MRSNLLTACAAFVPALAILGVAAPASAGTTCKNLWCEASSSWSDGGFGSSYSLWTGLETKADHPSDPSYDSTYLKTGATLGVTAKVLGKSASIASIDAIAFNNAGETYGIVEVAAAGTVLVSAGMSNTITYGFDRTLINAGDSIKILGIKIHLDGKVTGGVGVDVTPSLQGGSIQLTAEPFANAYAKVSASVGAACASVGVSGKATAIELSAPLTAAASVGGGGIGYSVNGRYDLQSLDGKIKVKLKYCGDSKSKTLVSFGGVHAGGTIVNKSGTLAL